MIETSAKNQRNDIVNHLNHKFNSSNKELVKLNWATKMILAGNTEDYYNGRFVDLEFAYSSDDSKQNIQHKTISLTKEDIGVVLNEFNLIKENLNRINAIK